VKAEHFIQKFSLIVDVKSAVNGHRGMNLKMPRKKAGVVCLDGVGVQFEDEVVEGRVVASSDHRQAAAQLVVPDTSLVNLGSLQVQVELEPVLTSVR